MITTTAAAITPPALTLADPAVRASATGFLSRVVPWPINGIGYVNLHYSIDNPRGGKPIVTGKPFQDIDELLNFCEWAQGNNNNIKELWYCTSTQSQTGTKTNGKPKAVRCKANALKLKAIWVDIDVGNTPNKPGKHYDNIGDAWTAICKFQVDNKLPQFSAAVKSGGGLHIYWISQTALDPADWQPYAEGLKALLVKDGIKCDAGLTTDSARILRIPGTLNHKYTPPRPVELLQLPAIDYDFAVSLAKLPTVAPVQQAPAVAGFDNSALIGKKPVIPFDPNDTLSAGLREDVLLDPKPIFEQCGFLQDAKLNGGKDYANPLWNLTLLCSTFLENGNELAHEMSKGHLDYKFEQTQAHYERKVAERQRSALGWPSCATIQSNGCSACTTCPHLSKRKSPLHLARLPSTPTPPRPQVSAAGMKFRDLDRYGNPRATLANAVIAIRALGIVARYDLFHCRVNVAYNGQSKTIQSGLLTDYTVGAVRSLINNTFLIDCGEANALAAINEIARDNAYDPVLDFLTDCEGKWDGIERLDRWVVDYLGCEDTPLNRAIGRKTLIAACHRARVPGCKHDEITVLEGPEGIEKSTAIRALAGDDNFNDQSILGASDREVQEQLEGTWMHENADLAGMKKAEVESVKAFARRQVDRARPAYGRVRENRPRRSNEWGTTNTKTYLQSQTGNRCFWPLECGTIDIKALRRDREQLMGEAATCEAAGESIALDRSLWDDAREAQEKRRIADPWEDILNPMPKSVSTFTGPTVPIIHNSGDGFERVASADVLLHVLKIPGAQQTSFHGQRLALVMANIGWERNGSGLVTINGKPARGYVRPDRSQAMTPSRKTKRRGKREHSRHKDYLCR